MPSSDPEIHRGEILISGAQMSAIKIMLKEAKKTGRFPITPEVVNLLVSSIEFQSGVIRDLNNKIERLEDKIIEIEDAKPDYEVQEEL